MGRRTLVLVVALLLAALAALAVWQVLSNAETEAEAGLELVDVYRTRAFIPEGSEGSLADSNQLFELSKEETRFLPTNSVTTPEQLDQFVKGRVAAGPISQGQILTSDQWVEITIDVRPLSEVIPQNKQAMTITASGERGVNGFINPGDRINLIVTTTINVIGESAIAGGLDELTPEEQAAQEANQATQQPTEGESVQFTRFVLQGLPVLAVGQEIIPDEDAPETVDVTPTDPEAQVAEDATTNLITLEVTPDQAERIAFAFEVGSIWLTLVPEDFVPARTEGVVIENLFQDFGILTTLFPGLQELEDLLGG
ncbi:MAG: Flp pilus assembly protein CpaB [Acidimicrobiia bacterium]|nr:Flp pilus assembly protein CpaB [Acidimicrobiia bacterium]